MRQIFIECETREEAEAQAPWACEIVEVEGGFIAFESMTDWKTWENQK